MQWVFRVARPGVHLKNKVENVSQHLIFANEGTGLNPGAFIPFPGYP